MLLFRLVYIGRHTPDAAGLNSQCCVSALSMQVPRHVKPDRADCIEYASTEYAMLPNQETLPR